MSNQIIAFNVQIRRARPEESALLTDLTLRSKAHWRYDEAFLAAAKADLQFLPSKFLPDFHVYVLEVDGKPAAFCSLIPLDKDTIELHDLFVEPTYIGKGCGQELWDHAVNLAQTLGFRKLTLTADPNAESFYACQGAVRVGEKVSNVGSDRKLPMMEFVLSD